MLKIKLFRGFVVLVVIFSLLSGYVGVKTINSRVRAEAQTRVSQDLSSAWAVWNGKLDEITTILRLVSGKELVQEACEAALWSDKEVGMRLERIRVNFGFDFLNLLSPEGQVMMRTAPPHATGDSRLSDPAVARALKGETVACVAVMSQGDLQRESEGLSEKAFLELEDTPKARITDRKVESRGMVMVGAAPVMLGGKLVGIVYGGVLLTRNHVLIDKIHDVVYDDEKYQGRPVGTATIFLYDSRIATTVRLENGNRAIGTRVSKEVADRVLDNGMPWVGEAFVVRDWYLSAYEPITDGFGGVVGMLYVGMLRKPYDDAAHDVAMRYVFLSLFVLFLALVLAFFMAGRLSQPIHRLVAAANRMSKGERVPPVPVCNACDETEALIVSFNQMAASLVEREESLKALNRSYMETLGFVSHELKSPVATIMNYVYLLREQKLGGLNEKQAKAVRVIESGSHRLVEMVRHYLNLSRIENHELRPVPTRVPVREEVLDPILDSVERQLEEKRMRLDFQVPPECALFVDMNMCREVFENMVSNAIKYGREGGLIEIRCRDEGRFVEFAVRNEGEGIPPERVDELFRKFSRLEDSKAAHRQKGTGLGLFITKHIVEAHGGAIRVASEAGAWAEFSFTLPRFENPDAGASGEVPA